MFGLFLLVCYTYQPCEFVPQGWVYPDKATAWRISTSKSYHLSMNACRLME